MTFVKLIRLLVIAVVLWTPFNASASGDDVKGMFVVLTSPDPQTQLLAMVLSTQTLKRGKNVRILLCGEGGDIALKNGKEVILKPKNKSPQMLLKNLVKKGVTVQVCPLYLPNTGASISDLIMGITQAKPPLIAEALMEPGVKLFSF